MENDPQKKTDLSAMLSSLLSNPELMERIKSAVEASQNNTAQAEDVPTSAPEATLALGTNPLTAALSSPELMEKLPLILATMKPLMATTMQQKKEPHELTEAEKRQALLMALKPFLSPERCRTLDAILRISQLGNAARQLL